MTAKEVLCDVIEFAHRLTRAYLSDFTDDDLLVRPIPEMNHVAWMLGHLIRSGKHLLTDGPHSAQPRLQIKHPHDADDH